MKREKSNRQQIYFTEKEQAEISFMKKRIGDTFRDKRNDRNYSIKAVAHDVGIGESTLSEIENGVYTFSMKLYVMLASYYGMQLDLRLQ